MKAIETAGLTKCYGSARGIEDVTDRGRGGGGLRLPRPQRRRQDDDDPHPARPAAPDAAAAPRIFGLDSRRDSVAIRARLGNLPGDFGYGKRHQRPRSAGAAGAAARGRRASSRAEELARRFRADLDRPLGELSRGNRQKVGLILAAFHRPELLILDEPTSGLDPLMQEEFLALVGEERERGCAVFLSSHELDEVERVCDRVGIIRDGRLIAVERVADLLGKTERRVEVEFAEPVDPAELRAIPGVSGVEADGARLRVPGRRRRRRRRQGDRRATRSSTSSSPVPPSRRSSSPTTRRSGPMSGAGRRAAARTPPLAALLGPAARPLVGLHRRDLPLDRIGARQKRSRNYPAALKEAFGIGQLNTVEQYLHAEMLSLIMPLAVGYLAVRAVASALSGAAESGRLDVLLSAPVSRRRIVAAGFVATRHRARRGARRHPRSDHARQPLAGAGLGFGPALAGFANVWPLALFFAALGVLVTGFSLRTSVVTGAVAGALVAMYVLDLVGRLDPGISAGSATPRSSSTTATRSRTGSTRWPSPGSSPSPSRWRRSGPGSSTAATLPPDAGDGAGAGR